MRIGDNIQRIRKIKGFKRSDLTEKIKSIYGENAIDYRTIERLEKGDISKGRFSTLLQIANALETNVDELLKNTDYEDKAAIEEKMQNIYISRAKMRPDIFRYNDKASLEIISSENTLYIFNMLTILGHGKTSLEQDPENTIKFIFIMKGEITMNIGGLERALYKGDSVQIDSSKIHFFENRTDKAAQAIIYQYPKRY